MWSMWHVFTSPPFTTHCSVICDFKFCTFVLPSSTQHKECQCLSLLCPRCPVLRTQTIKDKVETCRTGLVIDFIELPQTKWVCVYTVWALKSQRRLLIFLSQRASPLHHRDPWRSRKHVALEGGYVWVLPATQRSSPWSPATCCDVWSSKDLRGWKGYIRSLSMKTFITKSKLVKLWFSEKCGAFSWKKVPQ